MAKKRSNKKIYCVYCGKKNNVKDLTCKFCNKNLNPKEHLFKEYIKDHAKNYVLGSIDEKITNVIYRFIKSHLYGFILAATLIFTGATIINAAILDDDIKTITEKPNILLDRLNKCNIKDAYEKTYICEEGYTLEENICSKTVEEESKSRLICPAGYYLSNNKCYSNKTYEVLTKKECIKPNDSNALNAYVENDTCLVSWCAEWIDGECQAGSADEEPFTITKYCSSGSLVNGTCRNILGPTKENYCEQGNLENNKCIINDKKDAVMGCKPGYILNEECNVCVLEN